MGTYIPIQAQEYRFHTRDPVEVQNWEKTLEAAGIEYEVWPRISSWDIYFTTTEQKLPFCFRDILGLDCRIMQAFA